jgi:4-amino-4-deoxy-L-arabinose transferase-like glycosyltransferase
MRRIILFIIFILGIFFRFYDLTINPPSLSHDEVAIGYNAYSILKTGKDEYGTKYPVLFRSFDDYKLPGLVYTMIPSIAFFGLNELGVRFPIALLGSLSVIIVYFIAKEIAVRFSLSSTFYLLSTLLFALSPWHISFSRQAFESTGALFFFLLGILYLIKSLPFHTSLSQTYTLHEKFKNDYTKRKFTPIFFLISTFFFAISLYFYYSVRILIPIIGVSIFWLYKDIFFKELKWIVIALILFVITLSPMIPSLMSQGGLARISMVSVVNDAEYLSKIDRYAVRASENPSPIFKLIYNRRLALLDTITINYFKNLSFQHITISGLGEYGLIPLIELPFLILGIFFLLQYKNPMKWLFIIWFFSYPLIGALTVQQPNSLRTLPGAPVISLLSALGIYMSYLWSKKYTISKTMFIIICIMLFTISYTRFIYLYFDLSPRFSSINFADGHKQMVEYVNSIENNYDEIYITGQFWRPYIFMLFWGKVNPADYQTKGTKDSFGKFIFGRSPWDPIGGPYFGDNTFNPQKNMYNPLKKQLFVLSKHDYDNYKDIFTVKKIIDGRYAKNVFYVAELVPPKQIILE